MHLGYHELRNMLSKFREEREKRKMAPVSSTPAVPGATGAVAPSGTPSRSGGDRGGDYRASRGGEEYRDRERGDRDRGYERHSSSRYELVACFRFTVGVHTDRLLTARGGEIENVPAAQGGGGTDFIHSCPSDMNFSTNAVIGRSYLRPGRP